MDVLLGPLMTRVAVAPRSQPRIDAVDAVVDRGYARLGWRIVLVAVGLTWALGFAFGIGSALLMARVASLSESETWQFTGLLALTLLTASAIGTVLTHRLMAPLARWLQHRERTDVGDAAWQAAHRLPGALTRLNVCVAMAVGLPGAALILAAVIGLEPALVLLFLLHGLGALAVGGSVGLFGLQLVIRPLLEDIGQALGRAPAVQSGMSIRLKLIVALPSIVVFAALGATLLALPPGTRWSTVLERELVGAGVVLALSMPAALLLARSTLRPLDDLLHATERLGRGDLQTRVPVLSADEYGELARSFNQAIEGLEERQRLAAENTRRLAEVRESRARIVAASDAERRRVERNIHDGAQQRLIALSLDLRMLSDAATASNAGPLREMAEAARVSLHDALGELRQMALGLHPTVLSTDGLMPALEHLAERAPVPVTVTGPARRFDDAVEATAYFVICEALTNVVKHAGASRVAISAQPLHDRLHIEVADDGSGGAEPRAGSGLAGLVDRVAALDGTLTVHSPTGGGTRLIAELPLPQDGA